MIFLLVGSLWFWIFVVAFIALEFFWIEARESGIGATTTLALFLTALYFFSDAALFTWLAAHPLEILVGAAAYFVIGGGWGFAKWFLYLKERADEYREARQQFLMSKGFKSATLDMRIPEELRARWNDKRDHGSHYGTGYGTNKKRPIASENKSTIIMWMSYWPWSALWTLVRDPFRYVYQAFSTKLEAMSASIFSNVGYDADEEIPESGQVAAGAHDDDRFGSA